MFKESEAVLKALQSGPKTKLQIEKLSGDKEFSSVLKQLKTAGYNVVVVQRRRNKMSIYALEQVPSEVEEKITLDYPLAQVIDVVKTESQKTNSLIESLADDLQTVYTLFSDYISKTSKPINSYDEKHWDQLPLFEDTGSLNGRD